MIRFITKSGSSILVEADKLVEADNFGQPKVARGPVTSLEKIAAHSFEKSLSTVRGIIETMNSELKEIVLSSSEIKVEFGVKLSAEVGAIVAKTASEAHFQISFTYKPN